MKITTMGVLLVGQGPGRSAKPGARAFDGPGLSGERFPKLLGVTRVEFLNRVETVNLLERFSGKCGKGDAFDLGWANLRACQLMNRRRTIFLLAGYNVARAFGIRTRYFERVDFCNHTTMYVVPHPSGINRWWNDFNNVETARKFLSELFPGLKAGQNVGQLV